MSNQIKITGHIVGGPRDGQSFSYTGETEGSITAEECFSRLDKMNIDQHTYKVIDFDREKMQVTLMW